LTAGIVVQCPRQNGIKIRHSGIKKFDFINMSPANKPNRSARKSYFLFSLTALFLFGDVGYSEAQQWTKQGCAPSTEGQLEGVRDKEVAGAIKCVAPHPRDANTLYVGAVNGGVWRTKNALNDTPVWEFISGDLPSQSIGALEFDPTDSSSRTLVVGIGRFSSFGQHGVGSFGIFRTVTGSGPWTNLDRNGVFDNRNITGIIARGAAIVVATKNGGIWRTDNTGASWSPISGTPGTGLPDGNSFALVGDPLEKSTIYSNAGSTGIYQSKNMGLTWAKVSNASIDLALAPLANLKMAIGDDHNLFVAIVGSHELSNLSLYRAGDGTWVTLDIPVTFEKKQNWGIHPGGQGDLHLSIAADPSNSNICYVGGDRQPLANEPVGNNENPLWPNSIGASEYCGRLFRVNALLAHGLQSAPITHSGTALNSAPHADSRDMRFDANGSLLESDDGGVYKQTSPANTFGNWFSLNGNLDVTEIYSADWDANSHIALAGAQDNGTPQQEIESNERWRSIGLGDGGEVAVDDFTDSVSSVRYSSSENLESFRILVWSSQNSYMSEYNAELKNQVTGNPLSGFDFLAPIKLNRQDGLRILIADTSELFESYDRANTFRSIGIFRVNANGPHALAYGAADNPDIVYAGAGSSIMIRPAPYPTAFSESQAFTGGYVQGIEIDPRNSKVAFVIDAGNVYWTSKLGVKWINNTGNLAGLNPGQLRSIALIPKKSGDLLAVGSDLGVFVAAGPDFNNWNKLGTALPQIAVFDLKYSNRDKILLAATMGQGAWTLKF
jgi:hypothetical protein